MGFFSSVTDSMGLTDTGSGSDAAAAAAALRVQGQERAREVLGPAFDTARGELTSSARLSRDALASGFGDSQQMLQQALGQSVGTLSPMTGAARGSLSALQYGATPEGYAANIRGLGSGGALDPLIAENRRNLESELAAQGLTRSGSGMQSLSQIPIETLMGIESNLYGRQGGIAQQTLPSLMAQSGLESSFGTQMASNRLGYGQSISGLESGLGANLSNLELTRGQNFADIERGIGQALSSGQLAMAQADAADRAVLNEIVGQTQQNLHEAGMSVMDMFSMGG